MKKCSTLFSVFACTVILIGCSNSLADQNASGDNRISEVESDISNKSVIVSDDVAEHTHPLFGDSDNEDFANNNASDHLAYGTDVRAFDSIRAMKEELEMSSQAENISFYELQGLPSAYKESGVEWTEDYVIYYTNEDKVIAFMPFESEIDLHAMKDDSLKNHGTYENLLANKLIHDVVKTEIPTDSGISYECTYNTNVVTGLKLRYYEYQDPVSSRNYILSIDFSPDRSFDNFTLFVFENKTSFMCSGNTSDISLEAAYELFSVTVE